MAWGKVNVEEQRIKFIKAYLEGNFSNADIFRHFDISPRIGYKWIRRYKTDGFEGLKDRSRARKTQASETDPALVKQILEIRYKYTKWGPKKVQSHLKQCYPDCNWPSSTTIGRIFDVNGLTVPRKKRRRVPGQTVSLSNCLQPNDTWCTDFKGWFLTGDGEKCEPFTLTDAHSRFLLRCLKLNYNDTDHVWAILDAAFREYGLPLYMRHDNGPPFATCGAGRISRLSVRLIKAGVTPEWIDPGKPQQNGRHERMHLTLKQEAITPPASTLEKQRIKFDAFREYYNEVRPHESLGQKTPSSIYRPSNRTWNGFLKKPEYCTEFKVRKVCTGGKISWKYNDIFLGRALSGEPVGIRENEDETMTVYYGPIILGTIDRNNCFKQPENKRKRK